MNPTHRFQFGDRVVHAEKPEWGVGQVIGAEDLAIDGVAGQRLKIRFEREGLKSLATQMAALRPAESQTTMERAEAATVPGLDPGASERVVREVMTAIPEPARDPFASLTARLSATMALYRFDATGASLMDWAAAQSGLADPLSRFNRHELEELFKRYAVNRDEHLKSLLAEAKRSDPQAIAAASKGAPSAGVEAGRRLLGRV
ncbi:MAG: DUF3553 domain-containing protein [Phycisphaeraceae bacterium]|nr:DUF3553 domain-containing protein [Phycisphaeraceae bacterium]MCB9848395.1 DUF3553 domain-containing protein [Phycisphaeraceae bacterium]